MKLYIDCIENVSKQLQVLAKDRTWAKRPPRSHRDLDRRQNIQETWLQHIIYTERRKETSTRRERKTRTTCTPGRERERERPQRRKNLQRDKDPDPEHLEGGTERERERDVPERRREDEEETRGRKRVRERKLGCSCVCVTTNKQRFSRGLILFSSTGQTWTVSTKRNFRWLNLTWSKT